MAVAVPAFFIWVSVFNLFVVSVFWSFMSDIFAQEQAARLYGPIAAGGTVGGFLGPVITALAVEAVGVANLFLISAALLCLALFCIVRLVPWARRLELARGTTIGDDAIGGSALAGVKLVASKPFLLAIVMLMYFGVGVGTLLYNEQASITRELFPEQAPRMAYYAWIDFSINTLTLLLQLFVTRLLLPRFGVAPLLLIPATAMAIGFALLAGSPLPLLLAAVQVATRAGNFGMIQPGRESLFTRVDRETRYKAKNFIDTVVYRGGDLSFVWLHTGLIALGVGHAGIALLGSAVALAYGLSAWRVVVLQPKPEPVPPPSTDSAP
jgi:AAA family ATP:ADP antiporter